MFRFLTALLSLDGVPRTWEQVGWKNSLQTSRFDLDAWQSGCAASPEAPMSLDGTCFEAYWNDLPSIVDTETTDSVRLRVNAHSFFGRMGILKFLMFELDPPNLWVRNGTSQGNQYREWHWLWSYAAQTDWQCRSGRLDLSPGKGGGDRIAHSSWWGFMNTGFTLCILEGANQGGLLEQAFGGKTIALDLDQHSEKLLANDASVRKCVEAWATLFRNGYEDYRHSILLEETEVSVASFQQERFRLQKQVWKAHTIVIRSLKESACFDEYLALMPSKEIEFALGWAAMVEILASSCFPTDLVTLRRDGSGYLPGKIVTDDIWKQWSGSTEPCERRWHNGVQVTRMLVAFPRWARKPLISFWRRVARTDEASRSVPNTVKVLVDGSPLALLREMRRVMWLFLKPSWKPR